MRRAWDVAPRAHSATASQLISSRDASPERFVMLSKITPSLWYIDKAEEAAKFYVSIFPESKVDRVSESPSDSPSGPAGSVKMVEFTLFGQGFFAMSAGKLDDFNHAISFTVNCKDQKEIDTYWEKLLTGGGKEEQCGWLRDRYGVAWQIVPDKMNDWNADKDRAKAKRVFEAMMKMVKLDFARLEAAFNGKETVKA
jgi:predicted 3-demethylubiquinone-9 3-methyltransferase (glyoxalase superfamily)